VGLRQPLLPTQRVYHRDIAPCLCGAMTSCQGHRTSWAAAALLLVVSVFCVAAGAAAHSSLREPLERTQDNSCRIGSIKPKDRKHCPGPCSRKPNRETYKVRTFKRGETMPLKYFKNNHEGTYVPLFLCGREVNLGSATERVVGPTVSREPLANPCVGVFGATLLRLSVPSHALQRCCCPAQVAS